jgi:hypothetical protein
MEIGNCRLSLRESGAAFAERKATLYLRSTVTTAHNLIGYFPNSNTAWRMAS